ncbi:MAG TPA: VTC domain-containing protein [Polyangia bacterium]|jgi:SPX domain protein involved in polyphosphate accumulation|nr:VTC domain-containing protein [Polyangia bacterium]
MTALFLESPAPQAAPTHHGLGADQFERERRFLLSRDETVAFLRAVSAKCTPERYEQTRPLSYTRTTYLDTADLSYFRSFRNGMARRLRLREYAAASTLNEVPMLTGVCCLELKQSTGSARSKVRFSASPRTLRRILSGDAQLDIDDDSPAQLMALSALRAELAGRRVAPCLTTWYRRTCLTGEDGRVRITLDQDLTFCHPEALGDDGEPAAPARVVARGPARILEVKYFGDAPAWLARATAPLIAAPSFSKFRMGVMALQRKAA